MKRKTIDGKCFAEMLRGGTAMLSEHAQEINDLNVFPVPDGDTGTNMIKTLEGGLCEISEEQNDSIGALSDNFAHGVLLGARGNSGVILSQIFAGISEVLSKYDKVGVSELAINTVIKIVGIDVVCFFESRYAYSMRAYAVNGFKMLCVHDKSGKLVFVEFKTEENTETYVIDTTFHSSVHCFRMISIIVLRSCWMKLFIAVLMVCFLEKDICTDTGLLKLSIVFPKRRGAKAYKKLTF